MNDWIPALNFLNSDASDSDNSNSSPEEIRRKPFGTFRKRSFPIEKLTMRVEARSVFGSRRFWLGFKSQKFWIRSLLKILARTLLASSHAGETKIIAWNNGIATLWNRLKAISFVFRNTLTGTLAELLNLQLTDSIRRSFVRHVRVAVCHLN